jgi:trehalose 6-phosphate synthase
MAAWNAPARDLTRRMTAMRKTIIQHDVAAWADGFLQELAATRPSHGKTVRPAERS